MPRLLALVLVVGACLSSARSGARGASVLDLLNRYQAGDFDAVERPETLTRDLRK